MASSPMHVVGKFGRFWLCYASRRVFSRPGLVLWTGKRHVRVLPLPRRHL